MGAFIARRFGLSLEAARNLQKSYFRTYGTTLRGLMTEHDIPPQDFLEYVHDIDFGVLSPDVRLKAVLENLSGRKFIYTNASRAYADKVVAKIGLDGIFEDIFDIESANYLPKPHEQSYHRMVEDMGLDPKKTVMVEDMAQNLAPASKMGMTTVWVPTGQKWTATGHRPEYIDHTAPDLTEWLESQL
ncbi:hypothetical protein MNBD_ALPHA02-1849 [hydrothermal vent metagenome]|uniref:Pyrimidine 5'-nucleotidase n=1 Tax=hydrothermal vent metagenome TaxID=652676 RepID=A0A3B0RD04_9ZZZZ